MCRLGAVRPTCSSPAIYVMLRMLEPRPSPAFYLRGKIEDDGSKRGPSVTVNDNAEAGTSSPLVGDGEIVPLFADSRWLALVVLCSGFLMIVLDATIVNVALPSIQSDLGFSQSSLAWVINAYLIAFGSLLLLAGRLGDLIGRKRMFLAGLALFTSASLLCGLSWSPEMLVAARFAQGVGGAMTSAVILGMIVTLFPERREQARSIGVYSFVASGGAAIGLLAGGAITEAISWNWIFFVNLPIGIAAFFAATRILESDQGIGLAEGADIIGAILVTAALMLGVFTIVEAADAGWISLQTLGLGALSIAFLAGFVARQATAAKPLLPLRIFRSRNVSAANAVLALMVGGFFGTFFLGALYMQSVLGYGPIEVGLAFLPIAGVIGTLSLGLSERLNTRFGAGIVLLPGLSFTAIGLALLTRAPVDADYVSDILPAMLLIGVGAGLSFPALMTLWPCRGRRPATQGLPRGSSIRRNRSAVRSACRFSPRWPPHGLMDSWLMG